MKCDYCGKRYDSSNLTHVNDSGFDMQACKKCLETVAYVSPLDVKDYGEPWEEETDPFSGVEIKRRGGDPVVSSDHYGFVSQEDLARTVACVNALSGINPDKLKPFIEAVEQVLEDGGQYELKEAYEALWKEEEKES